MPADGSRTMAVLIGSWLLVAAVGSPVCTAEEPGSSVSSDRDSARTGGDGVKQVTAEDQFGQWRGPDGNGTAPNADPPTVWSETNNLRWKAALPGRGLSTPIVWGDRVFVTAAVPVGERLDTTAHEDADGAHNNVTPDRRQQFTVLAFDRDDGSLVWQRVVREAIPHEAAHETGSWASPSATTDGSRLYVSFGSQGYYALSLDGEPIWETDLGDLSIRHEHGEGSSPVLHDGTLVINWDHQEQSFLVALDAATGKQRWKTSRDEITSWSTPYVVEVDGKAQVIVSATGRIRGYDLESGAVIWECGGLSRNVVATPVAAKGIVYVGNSYDDRAMLAIRLKGARGDITGTDAVLWTRKRDTPYVPSPVLVGDILCYLKHSQGFLTCVDGPSGKTLLGPVRLPSLGNVFASPLAAAGRLYISGRNGSTVVLDLEQDFRVLSVNQLDDSFSASPAAAGGDLFLRGEGHLYCLREARRVTPSPGAASSGASARTPPRPATAARE